MNETFIGIIDGMETYRVTDADGNVIGTNQRLPVPAVPTSVTARQIRLWLVSHGYTLSQVESAISGIPDQQQREMVRVEWEYAPYVERTHPMLLPLAAALGLSESQVDAAFVEAATL